jgi:MFS family permease
MALWSMTTLVAPVVGPLLGGWITDNVAWPWIFYINVPVGLFAAGLTWSIYRRRDPGPRRVPLDKRRPDPAGAVGGRAAADGRPGQGTGLVRVGRDHRAGAGGFDRLRLLPGGGS